MAGLKGGKRDQEKQKSTTRDQGSQQQQAKSTQNLTKSS